MPKLPKYSRDEILAMCEKVEDIQFFYKEDFVKNLGPRSKKTEKYTEIIAEWIELIRCAEAS